MSVTRKTPQNYINHIALVLDASGSMWTRRAELVKVADAQIAYLAKRSEELDQETRITVYTFNSRVECVFYDKDVLRLPSIKEFYSPRGNTALIDATLKSQDDLSKTAQLYGDHSFLTFVLTDGEENASSRSPYDLNSYLPHLLDNWTVAVLVPDQRSKFEAKKFGFPADNIAIWDATTNKGFVEAGETIRRATDNYFTLRSQGIRGSRSIFSMGADTLNKKAVKAAKLIALPKGTFQLLPVDRAFPIREWVQEQGFSFTLGCAFYQLTKTESIQPQKNIAIMEKKSKKVFVGREARDMLGLPDMEVRVKPQYNPDFDVFVQSTSVNRKLVPGTNLLIFA